MIFHLCFCFYHTFLKRKVGKRNFGYWFCAFLFSLAVRGRFASVRKALACFAKKSARKTTTRRKTLLQSRLRRASFLGEEALKQIKSPCFPPPPQAQKLRTIKNFLRFELHFRLCTGKADAAEKLRLELLRGFRDTSRIAFFRTFFSKKKVHKKTRFASDATPSFRHFLTKMPPTLFSAKPARVLANLPPRGSLKKK